MTDLHDPWVRALLDAPNHGIVSTLREDGSVHSAVVWVDVLDGRLGLNSALGRAWPSNVERDPRVTVLVCDEGNPYDDVEVRGEATLRTDGADDHIDRLAKKYMDADSYPFRREGEQVTVLVEPTRVRHAKQG